MTENESLETKADAAVESEAVIEPKAEAVAEPKLEVAVEAEPEVEPVADPKGAKPKKVKKPRGKFSKLVFNPRAWTSYDEVNSNAKTVVGLFRRLFSKRTGEVRHETYEEAIARMGLSNDQIILRKKNFLYSAMVYLAFALGFMFYSLYLLFNFNFLASFLTVILIALMALAAYREHFWYMQMQKKKLGCDFNEWLSFVLRRNS